MKTTLPLPIFLLCAGTQAHIQLISCPAATQIFHGGDRSVFPEGVPIGSIDRLEESADGQSYRARVKLFADFSNLDNVFIVGNDNKTEQEKLEKGITGK